MRPNPFYLKTGPFAIVIPLLVVMSVLSLYVSVCPCTSVCTSVSESICHGGKGSKLTFFVSNSQSPTYYHKAEVLPFAKPIPHSPGQGLRQSWHIPFRLLDLFFCCAYIILWLSQTAPASSLFIPATHWLDLSSYVLT